MYVQSQDGRYNKKIGRDDVLRTEPSGTGFCIWLQNQNMENMIKLGDYADAKEKDAVISAFTLAHAGHEALFIFPQSTGHVNAMGDNGGTAADALSRKKDVVCRAGESGVPGVLLLEDGALYIAQEAWDFLAGSFGWDTMVEDTAGCDWVLRDDFYLSEPGNLLSENDTKTISALECSLDRYGKIPSMIQDAGNGYFPPLMETVRPAALRPNAVKGTRKQEDSVKAGKETVLQEKEASVDGGNVREGYPENGVPGQEGNHLSAAPAQKALSSSILMENKRTDIKQEIGDLFFRASVPGIGYIREGSDAGVLEVEPDAWNALAGYSPQVAKEMFSGLVPDTADAGWRTCMRRWVDENDASVMAALLVMSAPEWAKETGKSAVFDNAMEAAQENLTNHPLSSLQDGEPVARVLPDKENETELQGNTEEGSEPNKIEEHILQPFGDWHPKNSEEAARFAFALTSAGAAILAGTRMADSADIIREAQEYAVIGGPLPVVERPTSIGEMEASASKETNHGTTEEPEKPAGQDKPDEPDGINNHDVLPADTDSTVPPVASVVQESEPETPALSSVAVQDQETLPDKTHEEMESDEPANVFKSDFKELKPMPEVPDIADTDNTKEDAKDIYEDNEEDDDEEEENSIAQAMEALQNSYLNQNQGPAEPVTLNNVEAAVEEKGNEGLVQDDVKTTEPEITPKQLKRRLTEEALRLSDSLGIIGVEKRQGCSILISGRAWSCLSTTFDLSYRVILGILDGRVDVYRNGYVTSAEREPQGDDLMVLKAFVKCAEMIKGEQPSSIKKRVPMGDKVSGMGTLTETEEEVSPVSDAISDALGYAAIDPKDATVTPEMDFGRMPAENEFGKEEGSLESASARQNVIQKKDVSAAAVRMAKRSSRKAVPENPFTEPDYESVREPEPSDADSMAEDENPVGQLDVPQVREDGKVGFPDLADAGKPSKKEKRFRRRSRRKTDEEQTENVLASDDNQKDLWQEEIPAGMDTEENKAEPVPNHDPDDNTEPDDDGVDEAEDMEEEEGGGLPWTFIGAFTAIAAATGFLYIFFMA